MKALVYHGKGDLRIDDVNKPQCINEHGIIEVQKAGICGSDLIVYAGKHRRAVPPVILGHEFSGVLVERQGNSRPDLHEGDRVAVEPTFACGICDLCRSGAYHICHKKGLYGIDADGAFARFVRVPLKNLFKLPEKISFEEGAMIEPLAVAVRAVRIAKLMVGEYSVVLGAGPIGLLVANVARASGAKVIVVEPVEFRRAMAEDLGFTVFNSENATLENILPATGGREIDCVFDAAGVPPAAILGTQIVKRGGRIIIVAVYKEYAPYDLATVNYGEIQITGSCIYTFQDFSRAISLVEDQQVSLLPLVTHTLPLGKGIEAFEILNKREQAQKILLTITEP